MKMPNKIRETFLIACTCLSLTGVVQAAPNSEITCDISKPLSIPELVDVALTNNPDTRTVWWNARRASAAAKVVNSAYYPNILFHADVLNGYDYKFPTSRETEYTSYGAGLILTYLLYDFGERCAASEAAKAALVAANWQYDWQVQFVMHDVINNAYTLLNSIEVLKSRRESLVDAQTTLEAAEELNKAGLRSITDVYSIRATVSEMQIGIALQEAEVDIARANLAASMGICVDSQISLIDLPDPSPNQVLKEGLCTLIDTAYQLRTDLLAKNADLQQKIALTKRAKATNMPKVSFNSDGGYRHYIKDRAHGLNYNVALNLDFPLYDGFENIYRTRMAYDEAKSTESVLASLQLDIALEVLTYSRWFAAAESVLQYAQDNLLNSEKTFEGVLDKYKAGTQSIFDLTLAQRQLAEARIKHSDAKTRWYRSLAQLAYATGSICSIKI